MSENKNRLSQFWQELKRRKVIHVIVVYATAAFVIIELVNNVFEPLRLPDWTPLLVIIILAIGFLVAIIISWIFDISFKGVTKTEPIQQDIIQSESTVLSERPPVQEKSIIVLPFENISPDPDQEYFSDGLTEEIITDLSNINDLLVISRGSAITFKGTKKKIREIASDVNVRYVLEGSVRKAGNNLRISAQLIDANSDVHLWAEKYNGTLEDIFDIQEKVSRSIADALKIKLSSQEKEKIDHRPIDNAFAYDCYKRAYSEISSMIKERIDYGLNLLNKGLEVTGENPVIYAGIGFAYMQYANNGFETEESMTKAEEFLEQALNLDPELPEAHLALGMIRILKDGEAHTGITHFKRALRSNPDDPEIMLYLALLTTLVGQNETALQLVDNVTRIDPINPMCDIMRGAVHFFSGRYEKAIDPLFSAYKLNPESPMNQYWKALILLYTDRADEAYDFIDEMVDESSTNIWTLLTLFIKHTINKDKEKVASSLTPDFVAQIQLDLQHSYHIATFYSYLEEKEESLKWLENAVNRGLINYPLINEQDVLLENIRDEERFKKLMERVKYEWENFEV